MRKLLLLSIPLLLLAGCLDARDDAGEDGGMDDGQDQAGNATALAPLHWEADVIAGADPFNSVPNPDDPLAGNLPECSQQPAGQDVSCDYYEFTLNGTAALQATLAWGVAANDLDLYLYLGDTFVSNDGINQLGLAVPEVPPATQQVMNVGGLAPGTYTFRVVLWNAAADSYTLDVEFS